MSISKSLYGSIISQRFKRQITSIIGLDWTAIPQIFVLITLFVISRIPYLDLGYGADRDAWGIAISAFNLRNAHIYMASRLPGYPLPEFADSLLINAGWVATNALTMMLTLLSVIIFAKILKELNSKMKGVLVIAYAFFPMLWINSTNSMDYMWGVAFLLFTWFSLIRKWYIFAGIMMGLAIASRLSSAALIIPFLVLIWLSAEQRIRDVIAFILPAVITGSVFYIPLYLQLGINFLRYYPSNITLNQALNTAFLEIGDIAVVFGFALLILCIIYWLFFFFLSRRGVVTENTGKAFIYSGCSSITINHGLSSIPTKISAIGTSHETSSLYITEIDEQKITINTNEVLRADGEVFWQAETNLLDDLKPINIIKKIDKNTIFVILSLIVIGYLYLRIPYEPEYLLPAVPFALVFMDRLCRAKILKGLLVILCILLLLNSFVITNIVTDDSSLAPKLYIYDGLLEKYSNHRESQFKAARSIVELDPPNGSIVLIGAVYSKIFPFFDEHVSNNPDYRIIGGYEIINWEKDIHYVSVLSVEQLHLALSQNRSIYYFEWERLGMINTYDYDLADYGGIQIVIET